MAVSWRMMSALQRTFLRVGMAFAITIHDKVLFSWSSVIADYEETLFLDLFLKLLKTSFLKFRQSTLDPRVYDLQTRFSRYLIKHEFVDFRVSSFPSTRAWWTLRLEALNVGLAYKTRLWSSWLKKFLRLASASLMYATRFDHQMRVSCWAVHLDSYYYLCRAQ